MSGCDKKCKESAAGALARGVLHNRAMDYIEKWKAERERNAFLALADGTVFRGVAFGARRDALGEVVFNTGMCGYQEIVTDPSYAGQFVALTAAEIGNYGANREDVESRGLFLSPDNPYNNRPCHRTGPVIPAGPHLLSGHRTFL